MSSVARISMLSRTALFVFVLLVGVANAGGQTPTVMVKLVDQSTQAGEILECGVDGIQLKSRGGSRFLPVEDIESIQFHESAPSKIDSPIRVSLLDGSDIVVAQCEIEGRNLVGRRGVGGKIQLSKRKVRSIVFDRPADSEKLAGHVGDVLADRSIAADTLVVMRKGKFNAIEGIVKGLGPARVEFSIGDQTAEVALAKVSAITFFKAGVVQAIAEEFSDPFAVCKLVDGSVLRLSRFVVSAKKIEAVTLCGEKLSLRHEDVLSLNYKTTTQVPISELRPTTNDWVPLLTTQSVVESLRRLRLARFNRSFRGSPIVLDVVRSTDEVARGKTPTVSKTFENGIAMHGGGRIAWRIGGNYKMVRGKIGFAPSASVLGNVKFRMIVDGELRAELELRKSEMVGPSDFELELEDRQRLVFEIDYADANSIGDVVHLVDVMLEK